MIRINVKKAQSIRKKIVGLIGEKEPFPLLLKTRWGIHTFGVRFPLDIIILDDTYTIRNMSNSLQPNRVFLWNPRYKYVLELPAGTINSSHLTIGTKLQLVIQ